MGWVVYDANSGRMIRYYKKIGPAKAAITRHQKDVNMYGYATPQISWCSYVEYEGICMGLRGDEFKFWQFCNARPNVKV